MLEFLPKCRSGCRFQKSEWVSGRVFPALISFLASSAAFPSFLEYFVSEVIFRHDSTSCLSARYRAKSTTVRAFSTGIESTSLAISLASTVIRKEYPNDQRFSSDSFMGERRLRFETTASGSRHRIRRCRSTAARPKSAAGRGRHSRRNSRRRFRSRRRRTTS